MDALTFVFFGLSFAGLFAYAQWAVFFEKENYLFKLIILFAMPLFSSWVQNISTGFLIIRVVILFALLIIPIPSKFRAFIKKNLSSGINIEKTIFYHEDKPFLSAIMLLIAYVGISCYFIYKAHKLS